jgi:hypothetical protein
MCAKDEHVQNVVVDAQDVLGYPVMEWHWQGYGDSMADFRTLLTTAPNAFETLDGSRCVQEAYNKPIP